MYSQSLQKPAMIPNANSPMAVRAACRHINHIIWNQRRALQQFHKQRPNESEPSMVVPHNDSEQQHAGRIRFPPPTRISGHFDTRLERSSDRQRQFMFNQQSLRAPTQKSLVLSEERLFSWFRCLLMGLQDRGHMRWARRRSAEHSQKSLAAGSSEPSFSHCQHPLLLPAT